MKKQLLTAILAVSMLTPTAYAADWVYVSSWAYNDVSNFTNEGLLPDTFADVSDYRQPASLEQVCELLYSVREKILPNITLIDPLNYSHIEENKNVLEILSVDMDLFKQPLFIEYPGYAIDPVSKMQYVSETYGDVTIHNDGSGDYIYILQPENPVTRARIVTLFHSFYEQWINYSTTTPFPQDVYYEGVTDRRSTYFAKLNGIMDASYEPQSFMTIEQAIVAAYRLYNKCPATFKADALNADESGFIQTYSNGIEEILSNNRLILKQNGNTVAEYEIDVYKNLYCITLPDNRTVCAAQNVMGHTDIYSLVDNTVLAQIPYATQKLTDEYIVTKAPHTDGFTYGLCDYSGNTVLTPEYSKKEITALEANGFTPVQEQYRSADGWVYFLDMSTHYLYRVDTNGENEQLLADQECYEFQYVNGYVYALLRSSDTDYTYGLYRLKTDGTEKLMIAENAILITEYKWINEIYTYPTYGSYLYYMSYENDDWYGMRLKTDTDTIEVETLFKGDRNILALNEDYIYYRHPTKYGQPTDKATYCMNLKDKTDIKVSDEEWRYAKILNGNIYFNIRNEQGLTPEKYVSELGSTQHRILTEEIPQEHEPDFDESVLKEAYPGKGIYRYGKVAHIRVFHSKLLKIDENGFVSELSERNPSHVIVAMN